MKHSPPTNLAEHIVDLKFCIENFNIEPENYTLLTLKEAGIKGDESNLIYTADGKIPENYILNFNEKAKNCRIYFGRGIKGKGTKISFQNEGNVFYIGDNCSLNKVSIAILSRNDFVAVGEGVSVTSTGIWSTGHNPGKQNNGIIVGDHCLIASDSMIRPADGHPIIDLETRKQINISHSPVIIEPYCWIGQRAAILKNVRIGACSILSFNAVVTKSCDRFSVMGGVPAKARSIAGKMWLRNNGAEAKQIQALYEKRFANEKAEFIITDAS
ncbi:acyltransferase [Aeromonas caviae]|uniref:acyltransferase n=1 Tax=Aeromonas caviae TaxID=648 RepID=UPI0033061D81